jgi:UDP-3-O-[3-hydroxymyristoyl] glucosamine N-acyltransferase
MRVGELVERFGGQLQGDPDTEVRAIAPLERAGPADISFLGKGKLRAQAAHSRAAALILSPLDEPEVAASYEGARIVTGNPYAYFARTAQLLAPKDAPRAGIHPSAAVHRSAQVHPSAWVGPHVTVEEGARIGTGAVVEAGCYIGREAVLGEHTHFFANVSFLARCVMGARGIVHSGAVIGGDGFGFAVDEGVYIKIPQTGRVLIGDVVRYSFTYWDTARNFAVDTAQQSYTMK